MASSQDVKGAVVHHVVAGQRRTLPNALAECSDDGGDDWLAEGAKEDSGSGSSPIKTEKVNERGAPSSSKALIAARPACGHPSDIRCTRCVPEGVLP